MTNSPRTTPTPPHAAISMVSSGTNVDATMQAIVQRHYGPPDGLRLATIRRPGLTGRQVLVRVHAAGLNPSDGFAVRGSPLAMRLATGLFRPRHGVPGFDLAGTVAATGPEVTRFKPGDAVFGAGRGTCAEYAGSDEDRLAPMPAGLDFVQADRGTGRAARAA
jgi:NADPH:quinone reductase-like Zn-dependent oxidoreductase